MRENPAQAGIAQLVERQLPKLNKPTKKPNNYARLQRLVPSALVPDSPRFLARRGDFGGDFLALFAAFALTGCAAIAERRCDELETVVATSRIVLDLTAVDNACGRLFFVTEAPGMLDFENCTYVEEPEPLSCGYGFSMTCTVTGRDTVGTVFDAAVDGFIALDGYSVTGDAWVTWTVGGEFFCESAYAAEAWPITP